MAHNKTKIPLLYSVIIWISAFWVSHKLPLKDEYTLRFLNFLIIGWCNSLDNCCLDSKFICISFLNLACVAGVSDSALVTALPSDILSKNLSAIDACPR